MEASPGRPVLCVLPYLSLSGLELFGLRFCRDLISRGIPAAVAIPADSLLSREAAAMGIPVTPLSPFRKWNPLAIKRMRDIVFQLRPRAVIGFRTEVAYVVHLSRLLLRMKFPLFLFYRLGAGNHWRKDPIHRMLFKHVSGVFPNADHVRNKILKYWGIDPKKVICIKSGIDTEKYKPDPEKRLKFRIDAGIPQDALLIGATGRIHPEKGSEILLDTLFSRGGPGSVRENVHLAYIGREFSPGYGDQLRQKAAQLGVGKRFHLLPFRSDVENAYPGLDALALAVTSHETYAYVIIEAMSSGVVPIAPETGGVKEMFLDGKEGFFFHHRDSNSLRGALQKILSMDEAQRQEMGARARQKILQTATWKGMMDTYLAWMENLGMPHEGNMNSA